MIEILAAPAYNPRIIERHLDDTHCKPKHVIIMELPRADAWGAQLNDTLYFSPNIPPYALKHVVYHEVGHLCLHQHDLPNNEQNAEAYADFMYGMYVPFFGFLN